MNRWIQTEIFANYVVDTTELQIANIRGNPLTRYYVCSSLILQIFYLVGPHFVKEDREPEVADLPEDMKQKTNRKDCVQFLRQNWEYTCLKLG